MKTVQCSHPPYHHNGFVATYRLWTTSGGVHALLVLEQTELVEPSVGSNTNDGWTPPLVAHSRHVVTKPLWSWGGWAYWIVFMISLYMYYALCFVRVEHSVYHKPISFLINIYICIYVIQVKKQRLSLKIISTCCLPQFYYN